MRHPDKEIALEIEIEILQGQLATAHAGLLSALDYRSATPNGLAIKENVRWALRESGFEGDFGRSKVHA